MTRSLGSRGSCWLLALTVALTSVLGPALGGVGVSLAVPGAAPADPATAGSAAASRRLVQPTLVARARLSADFLAPGPPSGALATPANGRTGPFPGQVIPGFSGLVDNGDGTFWGLPDNGFGTKANSADFLLRMYLVRPRWETAAGGAGEVDILRFISLRDPRDLLDFPIVNDGTSERLLTGADFDVESVVRARDGSLWIGEEFGPFLLHVDRSGRLLERPVPFPDGKSPANPYLQPGETPRIPSSRGFEAMSGSANGHFLYPVVEGAFTDDPDQRRRWVYEFDARTSAYTGRRWAFQTHVAANVLGDAFLTGPRRMLVIERDDFQGPAAVFKRVYEIDLDRVDEEGYLRKRLVLDALGVANPHLIGAGTGYGTGEQWSLPVQSFEVVVQLRDGRLLIGNDNNYPGNAARNPGTPDDLELAVIDLRRVRPEDRDRVVIAHRGASGYRPEHTLAAYEVAILQCADYIEPDVVPTADGVLVARHENDISTTTDVGTRPEFASRRTTKVIDGVSVTGWFSEDFTLAELKTLRAKERIPGTRPENAVFDGLYQVPTLDEVLDLARHSRTCAGRPVGVYPETKHPTYFDDLGLSPEEPLLADLERNGYDRRHSPVFLQSFETGNLRDLAEQTSLPIVQLVNCSGAPYDLVRAGDTRTYADLVTPEGLREIAGYADGIGACKNVMIPRAADDTLAAPAPVIRDAHRAGLFVHGWTFRAENRFLPAEFRSSGAPDDAGDLVGEIEVFLAAGMDGFFTDQPDLGVEAVS